jgi:hypothetical protein
MRPIEHKGYNAPNEKQTRSCYHVIRWLCVVARIIIGRLTGLNYFSKTFKKVTLMLTIIVSNDADMIVLFFIFFKKLLTRLQSIEIVTFNQKIILLLLSKPAT